MKNEAQLHDTIQMIVRAIGAFGSDLERAQASITCITSFKLAQTGISQDILKICEGISRDILSNTGLSRAGISQDIQF